MKIKSEKGYSVVDIAIAIIVLFTFISILSMLFYNFNSTSNEVKLKAEATNLAVDTIEKIKNMSIDSVYEDLDQQKIKYTRHAEEEQPEEIEEGFYRTVIIEDYSEIDSEKVENIVKKVTVKIQYKFKKEIETIELSAIISKEK